MRKGLSLLLVLVMLLGMMPQMTLSIRAAETNGEYNLKDLRYDDHVDMNGKVVEIMDAGTPVSYQVGYGVEENTVLDTAVVTMKGNTLVATGVGTAVIKVDGEEMNITVTAAPISLLLLIGQSNMQGIDGNARESIVCPTGQVYATYADRYKKAVADVTKFAPSALAGAYSTVNVTGDSACLENYPVNMLTDAGNGREGMDSGIAYEWTKQTGEKVWTVNVGYGGSSITQWQEGGEHYEACLDLFSACQETLRREIAAGHFTLSHMGYFWCQGCADETQTAKWYVDQFLTMHETLKTNMAFSGDATFEFAGIIPIRSGHSGMGSYRAGVYTATTNVPYYQSFKDLRFNGPRVAQYWMGNNPELKDIWNVCTIQEGWATLPDGTDGVAEYFRSAYENGTVDYTIQVKQSASWYKPATPAAVHDNIHYNQIGFNEIGRESARNSLIMLGEIEAPETETSVKLLGWDGFTPVDRITAATTGHSGTLAVPIVYPVWKSKEVTCTVTDGLRYDYYDLLADSIFTTGTLTVNGAVGSVAVAPKELTNYRWSFNGNALVSDAAADGKDNPLAYLAGSVTEGQFQNIRYQTSESILLLHDQAWALEIQISGWTATTGSMLLSSGSNTTDGQPYLYFRPSDFFVGFGYYDGTKYHNHGVSLKAHGITCDEGSHTYRFVNHIAEDGSNMVWLYVDGQQIAPLTDHYSNSTLTESNNDWICGQDLAMSYLGTSNIPITGCTVDSIWVTEANYDPDVHFHTWSGWQTVTVPSITGPGTDQRICSGCGETQSREVEGVWQTHELSTHLISLPENFCAGTNLWTALEHSEYYYHSGTHWAKHESGTVYSVTIPVEPGDMLYATAWGKAGTNGHATSNGIRVTFFGVSGVIKTMDPAGTYGEFSANGGYLIAPEGAIAVNIPMWNNSDDNEIHILNRDHVYKNGICTGCGGEEPNPYAGKTIACVGDSITYGVGVTRDETDYVTLLAQALEMNYIRLGASGTTLCTDGHATCNIGKLTEENLAGADVVTVLMGINDFVQARNGYYTLGTIDSTDSSTIYGAVHMWCQRIEELRQTDSLKDTEFYFMTPVITSWNNSVSSTRNWDQSKTNIYGYTLRDLCNAIIEVCALYDIPVIDLNLTSGLYYNSADDNTVAEFGGDGAHPGAVGHQMMADAIKHALLKDNLRNDHDHTYGSWITTRYPDCDGGEQQRVCTVCTATESRKLDGKDHTYENGICTACGAVLGDLNLDGAVNSDDLTLLARHVGRIEELEGQALQNADVNGDGLVNSDDLTKHARYVGRIITDWEQE